MNIQIDFGSTNYSDWWILIPSIIFLVFNVVGWVYYHISLRYFEEKPKWYQLSVSSPFLYV